jgi:hypothetical protein
MAANVPWKATNDSSGMYVSLLNVAAADSGVTPDRNIFDRPPKKGEPPVKATE